MSMCPYLTWVLPAIFLLISLVYAQNGTSPSAIPSSVPSTSPSTDSNALLDLVDPSTPLGSTFLSQVFASCPPTDDTSTLECCTIQNACSFISANCVALGLPAGCSGIAANACVTAAGELGVDPGSCCCAGGDDTGTLPPATVPPTGDVSTDNGGPTAGVPTDDQPPTTGSVGSPTVSVAPPPTGIPTDVIPTGDVSSVSGPITPTPLLPTNGGTIPPIGPTGLPLQPPSLAGSGTIGIPAGATQIPDPSECEGDWDDLDSCCKAVRVCASCARWCFKEGAGLDCYHGCPQSCRDTLDYYGFSDGKGCCCPLGNS